MLRRSIAALLVASAGAACGGEPFDDWSAKLDRVMGELRQSRSLNDRLAFQAELGQLVREPVEPEAKRIERLAQLLPLAPEGPMLDGLAETLLSLRSAASLRVVLEGLERSDFVNLQGNPLGENGVETRRRVLEDHVTVAADAARAAGPIEVAAEVRDLLRAELAGKSGPRRRASALLIGGWSVGEAAALAAALEEEKDPWTRAILVEALGRTDPSAAAAQVLKSAASSEIGERLAAIPVLGALAGNKEAEKALGKALEDKRWYVARAAVEACARRRDKGAVSLVVAQLAKASPRLEREMLRFLQDVTGGQVPGDPAEVAAWWKAVEPGFEPVAPGATVKVSEGGTRTRKRPTYFSATVDTDRVCVVFDVSGSMAEGRIKVPPAEGEKGETVTGTPFEVTLRQIGQLLKGFKGEFNLISYSDGVTPFQKGLVKASGGKVKEADKFLGGLKPAGETNIYDALMLALEDAETDTIFFLSDGAPNRGARTTQAEILEGIERANRFRQVVIHTIQIGQDQELMKRLAARNGGTYRSMADEGKKSAGSK